MTQPPPYQQPPYPAPGPYQPSYQGQPQPYQAVPTYQQAPVQGYPQQPYQAPLQAYPGPQQAYQPQAPQYPAPQPQGQPYPGPAAGAYDPNLRCRVCGNGPAARVTFRGVVGAIVMHTIWTATGPFCRDCGLHAFRTQTAKTLAGGWCSIGAIVLTPIFLLLNAIGRNKIVALPVPQRDPSRPAPLDPGPPVFSRPIAYAYPVIAAIFLLLIVIGNLAQ